MPESWDAQVTRESDSLVQGVGGRSLVRVYRVTLGRATRDIAPSTLVKFSESPHAIPVATHLQIATPGYYRNIEDGDAGTGDELDSGYDRLVPDRRAETRALLGLDGFWLFCTSIAPPSDAVIEELRGRFEAEAATLIGGPAAFAREMGAGVAASVRPEQLTPDPLGWLKRRLLPDDVGTVVHVHHGPVYYADRAGEVLDAVPVTERATLLPFIKRRGFAWQREYRFTVSVIGTPRDETHRFPIPPALRALARTSDAHASPSESPSERASTPAG